jgi:hypothetical protein
MGMKKIHSPLRLKQVVEYIDSVLPTITYDQLLKVSMSQLDQTWRTWLTASTYNSSYFITVITSTLVFDILSVLLF